MTFSTAALKILALASEISTIPFLKSSVKNVEISKGGFVSSLRYPILLCHGLFGCGPLIFGNKIPLLERNYFIGVAEALREVGCEVYIPKVSSTGSIEHRANELGQFILKNQLKDVHLICHSMGGLDARFLISHLRKKEYKILSLTTVSTPHRGSPFADFLLETFGIGTNGLHELKKMEQVYQSDYVRNLIRGIIQAVDAPAYGNLTTKYLTQIFNPSTPDDPDVLYFSYGGSIDRPHMYSPLRFPWDIVSSKEGDNDGIVSLYSSKWGSFFRVVKANHFYLKRYEHTVSSTDKAGLIPAINYLYSLKPYLSDRSVKSFISTLQKYFPSLFTVDIRNDKLVANNDYITSLESRLERFGPNSKEAYLYGVEHGHSVEPKNDDTSMYLEILRKLEQYGM